MVLPVTTAGFINVYVYNDGATEAFFVLGSSSVVATLAGIPLPAGIGMNVWVGANTYLAAITSTSTTTLRITQSNGPISLKSGSGAGAGGSGVISFNTRTGAVVPLTGDYSSFYAPIAGPFAGNAATATALAANPTDCSANQYATAIDASGNLTCAQPAVAQVTGAAPIASPTLTGTLTVPQISIAGNISAPAWTTTGIALHTAAATYTDTTSSGTVASQYINFLAVPILAASSATTYTSAYNLLIGGAPTAGANVGITTGYALRVMSGLSRFDGTISAFSGGNFSGAIININASSNFATNIGTGTTTAAVNLGGGSNDVVIGSHLRSSGTSPGTPTTCGTGSPTVTGTDTAGSIVTGTAATACTLPFASTYTTTPISAVCSSNSAAIGCSVTALSATSVTFGLSAALSGTIYYWVSK